MNFSWLQGSTILLSVHGSQAYGLNHAASDLDVKGVCIPPPSVRDNLFQGFDQAENQPEINNWAIVQPRVNPANTKVESTIYTLRKFFKLAADVNPNIIEILYTDASDRLKETKSSEYLMAIRDEFLSSKAKFTFTGYAVAQMNKINRHHKWLKDPVLVKPVRADYGLPDVRPQSLETVAREINALMEEWNFHQYSLDEQQRSELKEKCWEVIARVADRKLVSWDNWPDEYWKAAIEKLQGQLGLSEEITALVNREHEYKKAVSHYESYQRWSAERNPEKKALEEKFQYDVKHAMHLVRLLRMGLEVLETGKVLVKRPDAGELLEIRHGAWTYDKLVEYAAGMRDRIDLAYKNTRLPKTVNHVKLNEHYHIMQDWWDEYGIVT